MMQDKLGTNLEITDVVAFVRYNEIYLGEVIKDTPKGIRIAYYRIRYHGVGPEEFTMFRPPAQIIFVRKGPL